MATGSACSSIFSTRPSVPFTHLPRGSLLSIMIRAPTLSVRVASVGNWVRLNVPLIVPSKVEDLWRIRAK